MSAPAPVARHARVDAVAGVVPLLKASMRQDARNIAPWVVLVSALSASSILAYRWIFTDLGDRQALASTLGGNPALSLVFGPARDLLTADGFNAWRAGQLGALFAGLMAILIVIRNSRAQEDSGQAELIASGVLGRQSRLTVAVLMAAIASVALGVVCFLLTWACGGDPASTAILAGTFTASGLMFAGVAAITAQIGSDAGTASSIAVAFLGVCYVARGYLDSSGAGEWTAWLTPFGWLELARPASGNHPLPLLAALGLAIAAVLAAFLLQSRRDFGQGLLPQRPGPATGGASANVWGLALRLNRTSLIGWMIGFAALGATFGNLAGSITTVFAANPALGQILAAGGGGDLTFAFLTTILQIIGIIAAVMGVQMILRIVAEENDFRVEPLLAGSLRRATYLASNVLVALVATALGMIVAGTAVGLVASRATDVGVLDVVRQAAATVPAVWVLVAIATAAVGARPQIRLVAWLGVVATFALTLLGPTFKLPGWALDISPLRHVPSVTAAHPDWGGLGLLLVVVLALLAVGFAGFRRRDVM